jgi:glycerate kinase
VIVPNVHHTHENAFSAIATLAKNIKIPIWLVSASTDEEVNALRHQYQLAFPALSADTKVLKTIIRSSPGLWLISQGTVQGKWSAYNLPTANEIHQSLK